MLDKDRLKEDPKYFIQYLASMSKEDIDDYIKHKGKPRKHIQPIIHLKDGKKS